MKYALYIRATGEFIGYGDVPGGYDVSLLESDDVAVFALAEDEDPPDEIAEYLSADQRAARPALPEFVNPYDLTALPSGTVITVRDESGQTHEITDLSETLTLEGPQTYSIKVDPPFPYQRIVKTVEVA